MQVNLAPKGLPKFKCLPEQQGQHHGTMHLLPQEDPVAQLQEAFADAQAGRLPQFPTIEWYIHTPVDPSLQDTGGHHSSAFFVQWVPHQPEVSPGGLASCHHLVFCPGRVWTTPLGTQLLAAHR